MEEITNKKEKAKKEKTEEKSTPVIRFFLSDGREIESLDGLVVPVTERTKTAYRLLAETN